MVNITNIVVFTVMSMENVLYYGLALIVITLTLLISYYVSIRSSSRTTENRIKCHLDSLQCNQVEPQYHNMTTSNTQVITNCQHLKRIAEALVYYDSINCAKVNKDEFVEFCKETYTNLLDDCIHFMQNHNDNIKQIQNEMIEQYSYSQCDIFTCTKLSRHYRQLPRNMLQKMKNMHFIQQFLMKCTIL